MLAQAPAVIQPRAVAYGVATGRMRQVQAVVYMQHGARAAGIAQGQAVVLAVGRHAAHGFQRVGQRAGVAVAVGMKRTPVAGKVERGGQVAGDGAAPRADIGFGDAEASLQEADHRGVVEHLRIDPAAAAPG
ncbi:hypothetical protein G6F22_017988 [Rhizopus arrhizus]|nr:hypothetical protein G6F22_017988 [Rhizopus arrhizus]